MTDRILIFIPMYNCAPQIPRVLAQLKPPEMARRFAGVICVDNRSTDATLSAAQHAIAEVPIAHRAILKNDGNYGLGGSHKVAIRYALDCGFTHLVVLHGDDQGSIADLVPHIDAGAHRHVDCLLGARFMPGSRLQGYSFLRTAANRTFNRVFSLIARHRLYDLGSGLNMYRVAIFESGFHYRLADDLTFNYYLILTSTYRGFSHRFFPLTWREDDQVSNARLFRQGLRILRLLAHRLFDPAGFMAAEHSATVPPGYPSTVVYFDEAAGHTEVDPGNWAGR